MASDYDRLVDLNSKLNTVAELQAASEAQIMQLVEFFRNGRREEIYPYSITCQPYPVFLRRNTSDIDNFHQVFCRLDHDIPIYNPPNLILDLGSYIGLAAVFYANKYPNCKIISVEPSDDNFELLKLNTRPYKNIITVKSAIWSSDCYLRIVRQEGGDWGNVVAPCSPEDQGAFKAIAIESLVKQFNIISIDLMKVDIEGSEKELFSLNTTAWYPLVKCIACETHDRFQEGCTDACQALFGAPAFEQSVHGEFLIFQRKSEVAVSLA